MKTYPHGPAYSDGSLNTTDRDSQTMTDTDTNADAMENSDNE